MDNTLNFLGLVKKAGFLAIGGQSVSLVMRTGEAKAVFTASDASDGSKRRVRENAKTYGIEYIDLPYTMFDLGCVIGRGSPGTLAITDKGLATAFLKKLTQSADCIGFRKRNTPQSPSLRGAQRQSNPDENKYLKIKSPTKNS